MKSLDCFKKNPIIKWINQFVTKNGNESIGKNHVELETRVDWKEFQI